MENIILLFSSALIGLVVGLLISNSMYQNTVDLTIVDLIKEKYAFYRSQLVHKDIPVSLSYDVSLKKFVGYINTIYGIIEISSYSLTKFKKDFRTAVDDYINYREAIKLKGTVI